MYEYTTRVRYSELSKDGVLSLPAVVDYFQDVSTFQSESLSVGMEYLNERNMFWVLSSWQICVQRYPKLGEQITLGTAPYMFKGFLGYRNFWMKDEQGEMLACANSIWSLISREGKPCMPTQEMMDEYVLSEKLDMDYADRHIRYKGEAIEGEPFVVKQHNLDTNNHVNNGQYVKVAMDYLPLDYPIHEMRAEYKAQALLGDTFYPLVYKEENGMGVSLNNQEGKPFCKLLFI